MDANNNANASRRTWAIIGGLALAGVVAAILLAAAAWQSGIRESKLDESASHAATAALLSEAGHEGDLATALMRQYVTEGDDTIIPQMQSHSAKSTQLLTEAVAGGSVADLDALAQGGLDLAAGAGQVIALRGRGDVGGSAAALEALGPTFERLTIALEDATSLEQQEAASLQASADNARDAAGWLRVAAVVIAAAAGVVAAGFVLQGITKRRTPEAASS